MGGAGAKILGPFKVGDNAMIGANSVVLSEVEADTTVIGIPGRPVKRKSIRIPSVDLDQVHLPDPQMQEICQLRDSLEFLEGKLALLNKKIENKK